MAGKPIGQPPSERSGARAGVPSERYGLLVVARHTKDDGRALILYTRAQGEPE